ncbi:MAG: 23S rRNA (guanosine(2251)-2'-O)-methyltransferase RlmB [Methylotetracoccus sp.]
MGSGRLVFGLHAASTAVEHGLERINGVWVDARRDDARLGKLVRRLLDAGLNIETVPRRRLDELARGGNHQGIILEIVLPAERDEDDLMQAVSACTGPALLLVLDQVQDPHNLGACMRSADAVGATGVVIPKDQSVGMTPTVAKVASGAAETVPLYRVTNLARCLDKLKDSGVWVIGASGDAPRSLYEADLTVPLALVFGAEGKGLRRLTREKCDVLVEIPMYGQVESLNVSVAAGVLLYEALRQRRVTTP